MSAQSECTAKLLSCLGLCARARKLVFGVPMVCESLKSSRGAPVLVLEAEDTSENTHKKVSDKCKYYAIRHVRIKCSGEELARAVGKSAVTGAVGVTDRGMAAMLEKYL